MFLRKAYFIEEESLKLKESKDKKKFLKYALEIYTIAKKCLEFLIDDDRPNIQVYYMTNYDFVNSKIMILEEMDLSFLNEEQQKSAVYKKIRKQNFSKIFGEIKILLDK